MKSYREKNLAPESPLQNCFDAFHPHDRICTLFSDGRIWPVNFPVLAGFPGDPELFQSSTASMLPQTPAAFIPWMIDRMKGQFTQVSATAALRGGELPLPIRAALRALRIPFEAANGMCSAILNCARAVTRIQGWENSRPHHSLLATLMALFRHRIIRSLEARAERSPLLLQVLYTLRHRDTGGDPGRRDP